MMVLTPVTKMTSLMFVIMMMLGRKVEGFQSPRLGMSSISRGGTTSRTTNTRCFVPFSMSSSSIRRSAAMEETNEFVGTQEIKSRVFSKSDQRPVILFDGVCNLCNGAVNLALDWDPNGKLRFAALQSNVGRALLQVSGRDADDISSIVLVTKDGAYTKSDAVLRIAQELTPLSLLPLKPAAALAELVVPKFLRDIIYDGVADNRYAVLGKRNECRLDDDGAFNDRFVDDSIATRSSTETPSSTVNQQQNMMSKVVNTAFLSASLLFGSTFMTPQSYIPTANAIDSKVIGALKGSGLVFKDTLQIERFEDPKVKGVVLYISNFDRPITEKLGGNFFNDPAYASVACARSGTVSIADNIARGPGGEEVFEESRSLLFKTLRVQRIYDEDKKTVVYVSYNTRLDKGSDENKSRFKSSLCAVNLE